VELLAPYPTHRLEFHPFSAVRDCLLDVLVAAFLILRTSVPSPNRGHVMSWWQGPV